MTKQEKEKITEAFEVLAVILSSPLTEEERLCAYEYACECSDSKGMKEFDNRKIKE